MKRDISRRPSPSRVAGVVLSALVATTVLAGCGDDVGVADNRVKDADRAACKALRDALPARVADQPRRTVSGNEFAAAWGDPAIVLRCGVGVPDGYDKFAACQRANGVDWFVPEAVFDDQDADVVMTTIGRSPRVEVTVPAAYRPSLAPMTDLAAAIRSTTRETSPCS